MANERMPNGFALPMMTVPILGMLAFQKQNNYGELLKVYPELMRDYYIVAKEADGALKSTPNRFFDQWIDDTALKPSFKITATVTGSAPGASATATLTTASHLLGGQVSPPAAGHTFIDDLTGIEYVIINTVKTVMNAHTVTLKPTSDADTVTLTTGSYLKWMGRWNVNEASDQAEGIYRDLKKRRRKLSTIRTDRKYSDYVTMEATDVDGKTYFDIDRDRIPQDHMFTTEMRLMFARNANNAAISGLTENTEAEGLIPQVERWGSNLGTANTFNDAFFQKIVRNNNSNGYTTDYDMLGDDEVGFKLDDYLKAKLGFTGAIQYGSFDGRKEIDIAFNFGTFNIYHTSFKYKNYAMFNASRTHGQDPNLTTGENKGRFLIVPNGTVVHADDTTSRMLTIRYQAFGDPQHQLINHIGRDGSYFGIGTENVAKVSITSYKGLETYNIGSYSTGKITVT